MQHAQSDYKGNSAYLTDGSNGFVGKRIRFIGKTSHAGTAPFKGINALSAFHLAMAAVNAQRETFRDEDTIRVNTIITKGGERVNSIPSEVQIEMFIRAKTIDALKVVNEKIDLALKAGAMGVGAKVEISSISGYLPLKNDAHLASCWNENAKALLGAQNIHTMSSWAGSTDMGDISQLIPGIHPFVGSFTGDLHTKEFQPYDEEMTYITSSKIITGTIIDLLVNDAEKADEIIKNFHRGMNKDAYFDLLDRFTYQELWQAN